MERFRIETLATAEKNDPIFQNLINYITKGLFYTEAHGPSDGVVWDYANEDWRHWDAAEGQPYRTWHGQVNLLLEIRGKEDPYFLEVNRKVNEYGSGDPLTGRERWEVEKLFDKNIGTPGKAEILGWYHYAFDFTFSGRAEGFVKMWMEHGSKEEEREFRKACKKFGLMVRRDEDGDLCVDRSHIPVEDVVRELGYISWDGHYNKHHYRRLIKPESPSSGRKVRIIH